MICRRHFLLEKFFFAGCWFGLSRKGGGGGGGGDGVCVCKNWKLSVDMGVWRINGSFPLTQILCF